MKYALVGFLVTITFNTLAGQCQADGDRNRWGFPAVPVGDRLADLLDAIQSPESDSLRSLVEEHFAEDFKNDVSIEEHIAWFQERSKEIGETCRPGGMLMTPFHAELGIRSENGHLFTLVLEIDPEELDSVRIQSTWLAGRKTVRPS